MKIAAFLSHPIQHFSPLWAEVSKLQNVRLKVFYFGRQATEPSFDREFGVRFQWDVDLLAGYESEFLPRQWPTKDVVDCGWKALNSGLSKVLRSDWDVVWIEGYVHLNNWWIARICWARRIPILYQSDSNMLSELHKPIWLRAIKQVVVRAFFSRISVFLALGDHNRRYLEYYGALTQRIRFSAIPVDTARFRAATLAADRATLRERLTLEQTTCVIGFCGKLIRRKRPQDLAAALRQLADPQIIGLFIGDGDLEDEVREIAGPYARFTGFVNQQELPILLSLCDVLAMPSEYDPHPIVVTEAQCLAIPVILSDQCGCYGPNDVFRDGETGILIRCGDVAGLVRAIRLLADDDELRRCMGDRAQACAEEQSAVKTSRNLIAAAEFANKYPRRNV